MKEESLNKLRVIADKLRNMGEIKAADEIATWIARVEFHLAREAAGLSGGKWSDSAGTGKDA